MRSSNKLQTFAPSNYELPTFVTGTAVAEYSQYLVDESRHRGRAEALVFPKNTAELAAAVKYAHDKNWEITASGARTGIAAGAVPEGGVLISLERMNRVLSLTKDGKGHYILRCQAGVILSEVRSLLSNGEAKGMGWSEADKEMLREIAGQHYFFPPDPTETTATVGGIAACNASGAHTFRYGPARPYIAGLTVVLADGSLVRLKRGEVQADNNREFVVQHQDGREIPVKLPGYRQPSTKNAAGYYAEPAMDLVDLFIGSEGTLGVISEVDLKLIPAPETSSAAVLFFADENQALAFVSAVRSRKDELGLEAIEYFGPNALAFLRQNRAQNGAASGVPACLPDGAASAIYLDIGCSPEQIPEILTQVVKVGEDYGADPETCWSAHESSERDRLRLFRHALPEAVNHRLAELQRISPHITKLGTDMAVPDSHLKTIIDLYRNKLKKAGLEYVIFGHIGDNHLHVNILPHDTAEYNLGKKLYLEFARRVVKMGGSPAAEHGIGKLKREFLELLVGKEGICEMRAVKQAFDPNDLLGCGTLWNRVAIASYLCY
ncbi:MAG: FAD-binding oxidoreductase [Lentisphaeria bacterium]